MWSHVLRVSAGMLHRPLLMVLCWRAARGRGVAGAALPGGGARLPRGGVPKLRYGLAAEQGPSETGIYAAAETALERLHQ